MTPSEHIAYFLRLATRPFDRNRTPVNGMPVVPEVLWRDVTPPPIEHAHPSERRIAEFSTDFHEEPTKEIRR